MHWKMAECSESAGRILTPNLSASGSTYGAPAHADQIKHIIKI